MKFALVFDSPSEQGGYIENSISLLHQIGDVDTITSDGIMNGALEQYHTVVFPGGIAAFNGLSRYGSNFADAIRYFVAAGGGYLGVCGGAYIAGIEPAPGFSLFYPRTLTLVDIKTALPPAARSISDYMKAQWTGRQAPLPVYPMQFGFTQANHPIIQGHQGELAAMAYSSGPVMLQPGATVDILAYFTSPGYESYIAIVATTFGQGRVVLCSPHAESPFVGHVEPSLPWLYKNMATWVAEREINVMYGIQPWEKPTVVTAGVPLGWVGTGILLGLFTGAIISRARRK